MLRKYNEAGAGNNVRGRNRMQHRGNEKWGTVYGMVIIYLISPLWSKNKQTVYDSVSGTVIRYKD
jgi:hypothetical protein